MSESNVSLKSFLSAKIPDPDVKGREDEFTIHCDYPVTNKEIGAWLREFFTQAGLKTKRDYDEIELTFNLENSEHERYILIVTNCTGEPCGRMIIVSFYKIK